MPSNGGNGGNVSISTTGAVNISGYVDGSGGDAYGGGTGGAGGVISIGSGSGGTSLYGISADGGQRFTTRAPAAAGTITASSTGALDPRQRERHRSGTGSAAMRARAATSR